MKKETSGSELNYGYNIDINMQFQRNDNNIFGSQLQKLSAQ